jgi:NAD(P)-dependent dehydrogenase (short-subunit alcohol dehydrogenase family)
VARSEVAVVHAVPGPLHDTRDEDFDWVMQVNVYGPYRVTSAFAPLINASRGRTMTIGSISGTLSPKDLGVYSMSKHAVEAYTDSLAQFRDRCDGCEASWS